MKKLFKIILVVLVCAGFIVPAFADIGPKPSVTVIIEGIETGKTYYVTLLGKESSYGPHHSSDEWHGEIHDAFKDYQDKDGYYYLGLSEELEDSNAISIGYYPPNDFKVLIYLIDEQRYICSEAVKAEAFYSTFRAVVEGDSIKVEDISSMTPYVVNGLICLIATVVIEVLLAILLAYKGHVKTIIIVNVITNLLLQTVVSLIYYYDGLLTMMLVYVPLEIAICVVEYIVYLFMIKRKKFKLLIYTIAANIITAYLGFIIKAIF